MTKVTNTHVLTGALTLALIASFGTANTAYAKPAEAKASAGRSGKAATKRAPAPKVAKAAKANTARAAKTTAAQVAAAASKTAAAQPADPDALLASLAPTSSAVKASSVDALVAKACDLANKPLAAATPRKTPPKLSYMRKLTTQARSLGFAPIMRQGAKPKGNHMVVRIKDKPLASKVVRSVVRSQRRDVMLCHESAAARGKAPRGNVNLRFTVAASGKVVAAKVVSEGKGFAAFERCLEGRIRSWKFPTNDIKSKVVFPFSLQ